MLTTTYCPRCRRIDGFTEIKCIDKNRKTPVTRTICPNCKIEVETKIISFSMTFLPADESE